jgi:hypothetical protein
MAVLKAQAYELSVVSIAEEEIEYIGELSWMATAGLC